MNNKWMLSFLLAVCALPVLAQVNPQKTNVGASKAPVVAADSTSQKIRLNNEIDKMVKRAQAQKELDPQLLAQAQALFQKDSEEHGTATHTLMYYYHQLQNAAKQKTKTTQEVEEYEPHFLYRAEELLQQDRNLHSGYAVHTLEYYDQQVIKAQ